MAGIIQRLIQATGKSADEIMEALGKTARSGADEIDMGDITDPLIKKGRPAKSPMIDPNEIDLGKKPRGSLELDDAPKSTEVPLNEMDMGDVPPINPSIDDMRLPTKVSPQSAGTPPASIVDDMSSGPLAQRGSTLPKEIDPEVIGKGTSRVGKESSEALEAELVKKGMNPKLAKIAIASGLIGGGAMMMGGGDQPPMTPGINPMAKKSPESVLPENYNELAQAEANEQDIPAPKSGEDKTQGGQFLDLDKMTSTFDKAMAGLPKEGEPDRAPAQEQDFLKMLQSGIDDAERERRDAKIMRAGELIGSGLSKTKADTKYYDDLRKEADRKVGQAEKKVGAVKQQQQYEKAQSEMEDEEKLRETDSDISKTARELAQKLGIKVTDKVSAKQLQDAGLPLGTLLSTQIAAESRREMAQLARSEKTTQKEKDLNEKQRRFVQGLRKEATTGALGKQYSTYAQGQRIGKSLSEFAKNPSGYKDYATLMGGLKALQGDESVVREAEVRLGMSAASAIDTAYNHLQKLATGKMLTENQRNQMIDTINILTNASRDQYMQSVAPILEQAQMEGIDPNLILSGSLSGVKGEDKSSKEDELTTPSNKKMVKVTRLSDGVSKMMPKEKTTKLDPEKYSVSE